VHEKHHHSALQLSVTK